MRTISDHTRQWIDSRPFIRDQLSNGIINNSALARQIAKDISHARGEPISNGAVVAALNRLGDELVKQTDFSDYPRHIGDISIKLDLSLLTFSGSQRHAKARSKLFNQLESQNHLAYSTIGPRDSSLVTETKILQKMSLDDDDYECRTDKLGSVTIHLSPEQAELVGMASYITAQISNLNINIEEMFSALWEFTFVLKAKDCRTALNHLLRVSSGQESTL